MAAKKTTGSLDAVSQYCRYAAGVEALTKTELRVLEMRAQMGDSSARDRLVETCLQCVVVEAKKFCGHGVALDDLINAGNEVLARAWQRFDNARGASFSTFVGKRIRGAMIDALRSKVQWGFMTQYRSVYEKYRRISEIEEQLVKVLGRWPTTVEIVDADGGLDADDVARYRQLSRNQISLDAPRYSLDQDDGKEVALVDTLKSPDSLPDEAVERQSDVGLVLDVMRRALTPKELVVVHMYFGLNGQEPKTLQEVGDSLGQSASNISLIMKHALAKLRDLVQHSLLREEGSAMSLAPSQERMFMVALDRLEPNPFQPRTHFDQEKLKELAASMAKDGLLQPIVVRQRGRDAYQLVIGERRVRAGKIAKIRELPAVLNNCTDVEMAILALQENLHREDLNDMDRGRALVDIKAKLGVTWEKLGSRVGLTKRRVLMLAGLASLPDAIQEHIALGELTEKHGRALATLENSELQGQLADAVICAGLSGNRTIAAAKLLRKDPDRDVDRAVQAVAKPDAGDTWKVRVTRLRRAGVQHIAALEAFDPSALPAAERVRLAGELGSFIETAQRLVEQLAVNTEAENSLQS